MHDEPEYKVDYKNAQGKIVTEGRDTQEEAFALAREKKGFVIDIAGNEIADFTGDDDEVDGIEDCFPFNVTDYSDDADALASAGRGTEEDYGGECWPY